jgi:hypothetical protein
LFGASVRIDESKTMLCALDASGALPTFHNRRPLHLLIDLDTKTHAMCV